jgi:hypothetical protein
MIKYLKDENNKTKYITINNHTIHLVESQPDETQNSDTYSIEELHTITDHPWVKNKTPAIILYATPEKDDEGIERFYTLYISAGPSKTQMDYANVLSASIHGWILAHKTLRKIANPATLPTTQS